MDDKVMDEVYHFKAYQPTCPSNNTYLKAKWDREAFRKHRQRLAEGESQSQRKFNTGIDSRKRA